MIAARRLKLLSLALLLSGGTVVLTQQWLKTAVNEATAEARAASAAAPAAAAVRVLVAQTELPTGAVLKAGDLRWQAWPAEAPTAGYLTSANTRIEDLTGSVLRSAVDAGEPLTAHRVVRPGERSVLAAVLRPGYRAVTVNVSASTGVAGFIQPGDHVDLLLSRAVDPSSGQPRYVSETVLTDLRVLAVDQRAATDKRETIVPQTATLEVTPKAAEVIAVASELGKLSLSLRSLGAGDVAETRVVTRTWDRDATQSGAPISPSTPAPRAARRAEAAPRPAGVEVIRGSQSSIGGSQ